MFILSWHYHTEGSQGFGIMGVLARFWAGVEERQLQSLLEYDTESLRMIDQCVHRLVTCFHPLNVEAPYCWPAETITRLAYPSLSAKVAGYSGSHQRTSSDPSLLRYVCSSFIPSLPRVLCLTWHISSDESSLLSGTLLVVSSENPVSGVLGETVCDVKHLLKGLCSVHASDLTEPPASGQGGNWQQLSPEKCHVLLFANCYQSQVLQKLKVA